ncbi:hypothetical protein ACTXM3_15310 [Glutamicibacter arilaitensis]|uniref:hypothetical protein n=1 Tax=Glutamicibacter arilaitensis TaxID=256701 RepID=UPI003FCF82CE
MLDIIATTIVDVDENQKAVLTEPVILSLITLFGVIFTAYLTYIGVKAKTDRAQQDSDRRRMAAMENRLDMTERRNVGLWAYCRALIDHIYKGGGAPPPDPPHTIKDLFD